ncbi:MAG: SMP-30/gluconolactonase/LRE family protein [Gammaproteobacteria bacterium]|jgi:xylono-1,5-lactonase|nr:SMP-30/gluconolactonase/LRE family protein [Gammaproteobacteria bacterium]MBT5203009.1 SMP-30/gluconolactonase/LRE family protein [Gammaproteobacteria bacterium]MBT5603860.1 SMP-30/gluconolactonase/LRE family protein [Gammaproteobacteria bacterium]MBT6244293.1 SMP-30/gluconolactonase/LRE family protein [Gammaproteobacteria bacterium]
METLCEGYSLVEGPLWVPGMGLVFSDVLLGGVFCVDKAGSVNVVFEHRRGIGGMSLHEAGGLVVSGGKISYKPFDGGNSKVLLDKDEANGIVGFNDITTDPVGRVYAGSLGSSPVFDDGLGPKAGDLFLIEIDGSVKKVAEDVLLTNGLGFSPDGSVLYHSDSGRRRVNYYQVSKDGTLGPKGIFAEMQTGTPDGLAVSEDGRVWVALAGGGKGVAVFGPSGELLEFIEIPQPLCSSVCFGGEDMKDLYIVSGSTGTNSEKSGAVYKTRVDVAGMVVPQARIKL